MSINLVVAITDTEWFEFLRQRKDLDEINFWSPSSRPFRALKSGELFLFKLHAPRNFIVGGGVFSHGSVMPCSLAWSAFGEANGAPTHHEMRERIRKYRRDHLLDHEDFDIGCRILTQPFFLDESEWIDVPEDWGRNTVRFKTYKTSNQVGANLWELMSQQVPVISGHRMAEERPRFGEPRLIKPRLGQGAFRTLVTDIYHRRCAVTRERVLPALDAAHIRPYSDGGVHEATNGILLRRDIHSLFDAGYVTVTPNLTFKVSRRIREEFNNGKHYYELDGRPLDIPNDKKMHPDMAALSWHNERFKG